MDREIFVQNIKSICKLRGIAPTAACKESGVGGSFINDINRGQTPSVAKVQLLAQYLGVTVSDLLGEVPNEEQKAGIAYMEHLAQLTKKHVEISDYIALKEPGQGDFIVKFKSLSPDDQDEVLAIIEMKLARKSSKK